MSNSSNSLSSCMYTNNKDHSSPGSVWTPRVQDEAPHITGWAASDPPGSSPEGTGLTWTSLETPASTPPWGLSVEPPSWGGGRRVASRRRLTRRPKTSAPCKHVPHREKPPQIVARRNARERRRVEAVNTAFLRLRRVVPIENNRGKRVSKVKTLHKAIEYISHLQRQLDQGGGRPLEDLNKENKRWGVDQLHPHASLADLLIDFDDEDF